MDYSFIQIIMAHAMFMVHLDHHYYFVCNALSANILRYFFIVVSNSDEFVTFSNLSEAKSFARKTHRKIVNKHDATGLVLQYHV